DTCSGPSHRRHSHGLSLREFSCGSLVVLIHHVGLDEVSSEAIGLCFGQSAVRQLTSLSAGLGIEELGDEAAAAAPRTHTQIEDVSVVLDLLEALGHLEHALQLVGEVLVEIATL